jgi:hypothetical protein
LAISPNAIVPITPNEATAQHIIRRRVRSVRSPAALSALE